MYTSKSDFDDVRAIVRTRKQREATIAVLICGAGIVLTILAAALWQWIGG